MKTNKKIRVVHLQLLPMMSGVQKVALDEMSLIDRNYFEPILVCKMPGDFTKAAAEIGVECHFIEELQREVNPKDDLAALYKLYKLFKKIRPDVVHTHSSKTGVLGRIAAKLAGVPAVVHTVHGFSFDGAASVAQRRLYFGMEWISARFCDAIFLLKNADFDLTHGRLHVPARKLHLIPNGVSMMDFSPPTGDERSVRKAELLGRDAAAVNVVMTGRLWEQKNPECFVRAAIEVLKKSDQDVRFYLIGDGPLRETLQKLIDVSGFSSAIKILGWRDDVKALLPVMDVFALPSKWEGLPLAILEAMAAGLPVVASNIPGNSDLVDDGATGYLFEGGQHVSMAEKLLKLVSDASLRREFGSKARALILDNYQIKDRVTRIERTYTSLLVRDERFGYRDRFVIGEDKSESNAAIVDP